MTSGFIKLHRRILNHPWLNDRPEYRLAWEDIILLADHKTGCVVLRNVPAKKFFSRAGWSRFISRLLGDGMLSQLETENQGKRTGKIQSALVTKYHEYHSRPETAPAREGQLPLEELGTALLGGTAAEQQRNSTVASTTANSGGQEKSSGTAAEQPFYTDLQEVEEVKEVNDRSGDEKQRAYNEVAYIVGHYNANWLKTERNFNFGRSIVLWENKLEILWQRAIQHENRKPRDKAIFRFQDAVEGILDLGVKPQREAIPNFAAASPALPHLSPGDRARTPDGSARTILDITGNGMVVFEDDSAPYHLKYLQPIHGAAA